MPWNYRLIAVEQFADDDPPVQLHKVYYNDDGSLRVHVPVIGIGGADPAAVLAAVQAMVAACAEPVLAAADFPDLPAQGPLTFTIPAPPQFRQPVRPERKTPELRVIGKPAAPESEEPDPA